MFTPSIQDILAARLQSLPAFVAAPSLKRDIDELVPKGKLAVIDDVNTSTAYGDIAARALKATHITLSRGVEANEEALAEIEAKSKQADMLVAVGSGTINDLVKYAAFRANKPYVLIPTAASMNGYVSANASITVGGKKQSLAAALPTMVLIDMQTIEEAPARLTQAGIGDSLARPTAQADWLLAHHVLGVAYDDAPFKLTAEYEADVFAHADAAARGDREAVAALLKLCFLSGFGMTIAGSSVPASGAEHMIAHAYHMQGPMPAKMNLHGEEIAVTTIEMATRQEALLAASKPPRLLPTHEAKQALYPMDGIPKQVWENAREAIAAIHISPLKLAQIRKKAGLPDSVEKLGWDVAAYHEIADNARFTRDRFTCLDVE